MLLICQHLTRLIPLTHKHLIIVFKALRLLVHSPYSGNQYSDNPQRRHARPGNQGR